MENFKIYNEADTAKVEILGTIGQSWFEDGNTLETVKAQLEGLDVSNIIVEIQSMGGDLIQGLALYDMFNTMPAKVTAKIIGATASAGTVVAMGADSVEITENSRFLIHNAMTMTAGNANDHETTAAQLKEWDGQLYNIYRKKTGKPKSAIKALMKDEKWISSGDAKEWGFVDKIIKPKVLNQTQIKMENVLKFFNVKTEDEVLTMVKDQAEKITNLEAEFNTQKELNAVLKEEIAEFENAKIETLISNAIEAGKFKDEQKESYTALAKADFENAKAVIDSIKVDQKPGFANFVNEGDGNTEKPVEKTYDWYVQNDGEELLRLMNDEPEKYKVLIENKRKARRK